MATYSFGGGPALDANAAFGSGGLSIINNGSNGITGATAAPISAINSPAPVQQSGGSYNATAVAQQAAARAAAAQASQERANTIAQYDDQYKQVNNQLGQLDGQQNVGLSNIGNSYNLQSNRLSEQLGVADRNYNTQKTDNIATYQNNRNSVMRGVNANNSALQRLLGIAGAGNSSASYEQAPYAAAMQGSQQLQGAQQTYGKNAQGLDTSWQDTQRNFKNNREDLDRQKYQQENSLRSQIASTRASLLDKIAGINLQKAQANGADYKTASAGVQGTRDQVNGLLAQITQLGQQYANPVLQTGDVKFNAPTLDQYNLGSRGTINTEQGGGQSNVNPAFYNTLNRQRDEYGNPL